MPTRGALSPGAPQTPPPPHCGPLIRPEKGSRTARGSPKPGPIGVTGPRQLQARHGQATFHGEGGIYKQTKTNQVLWDHSAKLRDRHRQ